MSLIHNLIEEPKKKKDPSDNGSEQDTKMVRPIVRSATDLQRIRLEKLMKNPDKPIVIPETPREKDYMQSVPTFVRNVMGSSAGAGSGEFHVYRHLRRKEYARQKSIQSKSIREQQDEEYQRKLEENRRKAEEKTAKKRAKRLKRKERAKKPRPQKQDELLPPTDENESASESEEEQISAAEQKTNVETTQANNDKINVEEAGLEQEKSADIIQAQDNNSNAEISSKLSVQNGEENKSLDVEETKQGCADSALKVAEEQLKSDKESSVEKVTNPEASQEPSSQQANIAETLNCVNKTEIQPEPEQQFQEEHEKSAKDTTVIETTMKENNRRKLKYRPWRNNSCDTNCRAKPISTEKHAKQQLLEEHITKKD